MSRVKVGTVLDGSSPFRFPFKVEKGTSLPLHEYVTVEIEGRMVLAEVVDVGAKNPLVRELLAGLAEERGIEKFGYEIALAEVLGYLEEGRIMRPKYAPKPNTAVFKADAGTLQMFYRGDAERLPVHVGTLIHRDDVNVPVHLQDLSFHLGIFAQTRGGKSYLAGALIEGILRNTHFPVVVIDIHGDYVMMDRMRDAETGNEYTHNEFDVTVYYPPGAPRISGVTAEERELKISPKQMTNEAVMTLLGHLGELQSIVLREILDGFRKGDRPFGLGDVISEIEDRLEDKELKSDERRRLTSILLRLKDVEEEVQLPAEGTPVQEFLRPKTLSVICLRGLRSRIQDAYTGVIIDLLFRNQVSNFGDVVKAPPTFLFIEEAHRVASADRSTYAAKVISTAIREGAKFGLYLGLISQRPRSIHPDTMANIGNYAVLRITNAQDQNMIENASESFSHRFIEDLPALNQGEAVLVGPYVPLPAIIKVSDRRTVHHGVTPNLLDIEKKIKERVEEVRNEKW